jgi:hypothetical protein
VIPVSTILTLYILADLFYLTLYISSILKFRL